VVVDAASENGGLRGVVAIGASAGGVEALSRLAAGLSPDVPYAYLIVLHVPAQSPHDALFPAMPKNAFDAGVVDRQAAAADIGAVLKELSHREIKESARDDEVVGALWGALLSERLSANSPVGPIPGSRGG
jgi:chemotaxis response regulator CheB